MNLIKDCLKDYIYSNERLIDIFIFEEIKEVWRKIGSMFKSSVWVLCVDKNILYLASDNNIYLYHLKQLKKDVIVGFNNNLKFIKIKDVRFKFMKRGMNLHRKSISKTFERFNYIKNGEIPGYIEKKINSIVSDIENKEISKKLANIFRKAYLYEEFNKKEA